MSSSARASKLVSIPTFRATLWIFADGRPCCTFTAATSLALQVQLFTNPHLQHHFKPHETFSQSARQSVEMRLPQGAQPPPPPTAEAATHTFGSLTRAARHEQHDTSSATRAAQRVYCVQRLHSLRSLRQALKLCKFSTTLRTHAAPSSLPPPPMASLARLLPLQPFRRATRTVWV